MKYDQTVKQHLQPSHKNSICHNTRFQIKPFSVALTLEFRGEDTDMCIVRLIVMWKTNVWHRQGQTNQRFVKIWHSLEDVYTWFLSKWYFKKMYGRTNMSKVIVIKMMLGKDENRKWPKINICERTLKGKLSWINKWNKNEWCFSVTLMSSSTVALKCKFHKQTTY